MFNKSKIFAGVLGSALLMTGAVAFAGTAYTYKEVRILPGNNKGVTSSIQQKAATGGYADLGMNATEALTPDVRTEGVNGTYGAYVRNVQGGNSYMPSAPQSKDANVWLYFSSDLFAPDSGINYNWRSN